MIAEARIEGLRVLCLVAWSVLVMMAIATDAGAQDGTKNFVMHQSAKPLAVISFADENGKAQSLDKWQGRVVVLNIWATWCVPCRTEMPTLDRLQAALGGEDFDVLAVSIDRGGLDAVGKFFSEIGVKHLAKYTDVSGKMLRTVEAIGLPTTLIVDRSGNEAGRVIGPAEWDAPEVIRLLKSAMAKSNAPPASTTGVAQSERPGLLSRSLQWVKEWAQ